MDKGYTHLKNNLKESVLKWYNTLYRTYHSLLFKCTVLLWNSRLCFYFLAYYPNTLFFHLIILLALWLPHPRNTIDIQRYKHSQCTYLAFDLWYTFGILRYKHTLFSLTCPLTPWPYLYPLYCYRQTHLVQWNSWKPTSSQILVYLMSV